MTSEETARSGKHLVEPLNEITVTGEASISFDIATESGRSSDVLSKIFYTRDQVILARDSEIFWLLRADYFSPKKSQILFVNHGLHSTSRTYHKGITSFDLLGRLFAFMAEPNSIPYDEFDASFLNADELLKGLLEHLGIIVYDIDTTFTFPKE